MKIVLLVTALACVFGGAGGQLTDPLTSIIITLLQGLFQTPGSQFDPAVLPWIGTGPVAVTDCGNFFSTSGNFASSELRQMTQIINKWMCSITKVAVDLSREFRIMLSLITGLFPEYNNKCFTDGDWVQPSLVLTYTKDDVDRLALFDQMPPTKYETTFFGDYKYRGESADLIFALDRDYNYLVYNYAMDRIYTIEIDANSNDYMVFYGRDPCSSQFSKIDEFKFSDNYNFYYLALDPSQEYLLATGIECGNVVLVSLYSDGTFDDIEDVMTGVDKCEPSYEPRMVAFVPKVGNTFGVAYEGDSYVVFYNLDYEDDDIELYFRDTYSLEIEFSDGDGPTEFVFSFDNQYLYVVCNKIHKVHVYAVIHTNFKRMYRFEKIQELSTDKPGATNICHYYAQIRISPRGRFLYTMNQQDNYIGMFSVNQTTGMLTTIGFQDSLGKDSFYMEMSPDGTRLGVTDYNGGSAVIFNINAYDGKLSGPKIITGFTKVGFPIFPPSFIT